jgi:acetyl esterase/lipase
MKSIFRTTALMLSFASVILAATVAPTTTLKNSTVVTLWPKGTPDFKGKGGPEIATASPKAGISVTRITNVSTPTISVRTPPNATGPCPAVIVCPGGGYSILAYDLEGTEVVDWLNSIGVAGVLLKYRVPRQQAGALQDAQRAVSIVRSRAKEWNIDSKRIGILGFSAGGHLAARTSTNYTKRSYKPVDAADKASCRPDFAVLIYPAYLTLKGGRLDTAALPVTNQTPGTFIAVAFNDKFTPSALHYFAALCKAKVRSELHVFQTGGHGCGLRKTDATITTWPARCEEWMRSTGLLGKIRSSV